MGGLSDTKNSIFQFWKKFLENFIGKLPHTPQYSLIRKNLEKFVGKCIICTITLYYNFFGKYLYPLTISTLKNFIGKFW